MMQIFTLPEAAAYLNISPVHFLKLAQTHGIPTVDFGAHCKRWRRVDLNSLAKKCLVSQPSDNELTQNAKEMIHGRLTS
jgi:hypothetical protein